MTTLDRTVVDLGNTADALSERSLVALFAACASGLLPEYRKWADIRGHPGLPLLERALAVADAFAVLGTEPTHAELANLLEALDTFAPPGESPDDIPSTNAQDCWICADVCIRVLVDPTYNDAGGVIWYALEPMLQQVAEELFGVAEVGGGDSEEAETLQILHHPRVVAAMDFCRWAMQLLGAKPSPTREDLALLRSRASVLAP